MTFENDTLESDWEVLLYLIEQRERIPFLGAGISSPYLPIGSQIAKEWAQAYNYPFEDSQQLTKVSQFLAIENDDNMYPKIILQKRFSKVSPPEFSRLEFENTPHRVLADLELPLYITTNYDYFIKVALRSCGKNLLVNSAGGMVF
jgi:hypothetical protein